MTPDEYLRGILSREAVDTGPFSPVRRVVTTLQPIIAEWAGNMLLGLSPSGSFAKGTANRSGTDIDLFISLSPDVSETLQDIYKKLVARIKEKGYSPRQQNVSIGIRVSVNTGTILAPSLSSYDVDLVPAKKQNNLSNDHSLYRRKADTWTKTNVAQHITHVGACGRLEEIRILKLWRNQNGLDFPSFYLELTAIDALRGQSVGGLGNNVWKVFEYLRDSFLNAKVTDPANTNNTISDDLTAAERGLIKAAAVKALAAKQWSEIVK